MKAYLTIYPIVPQPMTQADKIFRLINAERIPFNSIKDAVKYAKEDLTDNCEWYVNTNRGCHANNLLTVFKTRK